MFGAEGLDELGVLGFSASLVEDTEMGLTLVECLSSLSESTSESVVNHRDLEDLLKSILYHSYLTVISLGRVERRGEREFAYLDRHLSLGSLGFLNLSLLNFNVVNNRGFASVITHVLLHQERDREVSWGH